MSFLDILRRLFGLIQNPSKPPSSPPPSPTPPSPAPAPETVVAELLEAHNKIRLSNGVPALRLSDRLTQVAQAHSSDQASRQKMSHTGSDGSSPFQRIAKAGYRYMSAGENVAMGYKDVPSVMKGWMSSPGHRENILRRYSEVGFGRAADSRGRFYWTAVFAIPISGQILAVSFFDPCPDGIVDSEAELLV